jgi:probable phosphoglycerate mutase
MFTELWLIRHGETDWTVEGRHNGRTDIPLNPRGLAQAEALRESLASFDVVFCSPLARARQTAAACIPENRITISDSLREWNYGAYEGRSALDLRREIPGWTPWTHGFPNGESLAEVAKRAEVFLSCEIPARPGRIAVFAHGHILRFLAACALGMRAETAAHLALAPGSLSIIAREYERPAIRLWNFTPWSAAKE